MPIRIFETGGLLGVAIDAAMSIKAPFRDGGQRPALISIVFSVVALEGFLNEITELALDSRRYVPNLDPPVISVLADFFSDAEKSRASLESKFIIANWILSQKTLDQGAQPYQDFSLLMRLRNDLVHFKANESFEQSATPEEIHAALFRKFDHKNLLAENTRYSEGTWTFLIETKAMAEWSCKTAAKMVLDFCSKVPQSSLSPTLNHFQMAFGPDTLFRTFAGKPNQ